MKILLILPCFLFLAFAERPRHTPTPRPTAIPTAAPTAVPTATATQNYGIGVTYLVQSDTVENPMSPSKLDRLSAWTNDKVKCVEIRSSWDRIEQSKGQFYWDFFDKGVALAKENGKKIRIAVTAGVDTPKDVCNDPAACFKIIDTNGALVNTSVPWNPTFQARWGAFLKALGERYDKDIIQIDMAGYMRRAEGYFVRTQEEQDAVEKLAKDAGYPDARTALITAAKWIMDQYALYFSHANFICVTGSLWPQPDDTTMKTIVDYGAEKYKGRFGAATHGLTSKQPGDGSMWMTLPRTIRIGAQTATTLGNDTVEGKGAVDRAIKAGAEWIELRPADCDNLNQAANLDAANAAMVK